MGKLGSSLLLMVFPFLGACALPPAQHPTENMTMNEHDFAMTTLQHSLTPYLIEHPNKSATYPLTNAMDAFSSRVLLMRLAERSLDVQYYIWRKDSTGVLLLNELYQAAERGVRVRLLVDDLGTSGLDDWLSLLDQHPNIEVRLFNPFAIRRLKTANFVTDFSRLNRRMHNKSITVDNSLSILGGRNIGDEYFAATHGVLFADLDVVTAGPIVQDISDDFERYWQSQSSYPAEQIITKQGNTADLLAQNQRILAMPEAQKYLQALAFTPFMHELLNQKLAFNWVPVKLVSDNPAKGLGQETDSDLMIFQLQDLIGEEVHSFDLISPYFVPSKKGTRALVEMATAGTKIRILTNSLQATDVTAVHSGYIKYRKALLQAGIELYEMQGKPSKEEEKKRGLGMFGSSGSSLHAKTFALNNERIFVGSFNFDPRSARLNTEMGVLIDDQEFAQSLNRAFDEKFGALAYQVKLDEDGNIYWQERSNPPRIYTTEPQVGLFRRSLIRFLSWLPLDWLL